MGERPGSFSRDYMSEYKKCWKDMCQMARCYPSDVFYRTHGRRIGCGPRMRSFPHTHHMPKYTWLTGYWSHLPGRRTAPASHTSPLASCSDHPLSGNSNSIRIALSSTRSKRIGIFLEMIHGAMWLAWRMVPRKAASRAHVTETTSGRGGKIGRVRRLRREDKGRRQV